MKRFIITASETAVYQHEIEAENKEDAIKEFYECMLWLEPEEFTGFQVDGVVEEEIK
jgi:hypothetical protein